MANWLLLHYKIPSEPSAPRVYIWRKLKRLGAVLFQDAVWALPDTSRNYEQFQWLSMEITERGGEATFWRAQPALSGHDEGLIQLFDGQIEAEYRELLEALERPDASLEEVSRRYQLIRSRDYFDSEIGQRVRHALLALRGGEE